ncbi:S9 family peptidase [Rubricoccus marinus]|uniref:S9 family peptidase n=1 Tax=Rubricoccus marinus TaxID=716817 RepID=A0A259TYW3_9BACT|nr:prolyl oligopeptidase family serine peptidase [Rubricoccus marinus]OZC02965.1 S9 family peptidase [Rubricoccus marinus]
MLRFLAPTFALLIALPLAAQDDLTYQRPAPELAALVDAPRTPAVSLSPDRSTMALLERSGAPSVAELSQPEIGLAGSRVNPRTNGPSRANGYTGVALQAVMGGEARTVSGLPPQATFRSAEWSPDGRHLAMLTDFDDRIELWTVDVASASGRRLLATPVNDAAPGSTFEWLPSSDALVVRTVPEGRAPLAQEARVPTGPVVQQSDGEAAPARTYQDLLASPQDEALFDHYMTSRLMVVGLDGSTQRFGPDAVYTSLSPSPDGRLLMTETRQRPYSYLVPWYRFPVRVEVWDVASGESVHVAAENPLAERVPIAFGSVPTGPRSFGWRADVPATLVWTEAQDGGDASAPAEVRDQVYTHAAPFAGEPTPLVTLPLRYGGITWGDEDTAIVEESMWSDRTRRAYVVDPSQSDAKRELFTVSFEDRYNDPGRPMTEATPTGARVLTLDGDATFWTGQGASAEGNRPFVVRRDLASGETQEVFRSEAPYYESPVAFLDARGQTLMTRRETVTEPPNYRVRNLASGESRAVTAFPHPYPELANIQKETIEYERADGVPLSATLYLPAGYDAERDGPLPTLVWAYPTEFKSADAAGQRSDSPYQFTYVSYWGAVPFVTRGYAVLDDASFPVVGEGDDQPNDTFREQLVMNAQAAIDAGVARGVTDPDRVAVGGHSYGAFMVGNLLAHSDLFAAGIARSGAYNRTLTPFGFQREERTFWDDPMLYFGMSPFMHAEKIDEPILMIHGQADNNPGTFTIQSERLYGAIKGLGGTARLVLLPAESHGYSARESLLHMLWEEDQWLETYVKNAPSPEASGGDASPSDAGR